MASRRQQQLPSTDGSTTNVLPIHNVQKRKLSYAVGASNDTPNTTATPNVGNGTFATLATQLCQVLCNFFGNTFFKLDVRDRSDATAKRRFQVRVPCRLVTILALVFLIVPVFIFLHKEAHIHEDHDEAHFKSKNYLNVNARDVFADFSEHLSDSDNSNVEGASSPAVVKAGGNVDASDVKSLADEKVNEVGRDDKATSYSDNSNDADATGEEGVQDVLGQSESGNGTITAAISSAVDARDEYDADDVRDDSSHTISSKLSGSEPTAQNATVSIDDDSSRLEVLEARNATTRSR